MVDLTEITFMQKIQQLHLLYGEHTVLKKIAQEHHAEAVNIVQTNACN